MQSRSAGFPAVQETYASASSFGDKVEAAKIVVPGNALSNDRPGYRPARGISDVLIEFHGSVPVKGGEGLAELLELEQDRHKAFFSCHNEFI